MLVAPLTVVAAGVRPHADHPDSLLPVFPSLPVSAPDTLFCRYRTCFAQQSC